MEKAIDAVVIPHAVLSWPCLTTVLPRRYPSSERIEDGVVEQSCRETCHRVDTSVDYWQNVWTLAWLVEYRVDDLCSDSRVNRVRDVDNGGR